MLASGNNSQLALKSYQHQLVETSTQPTSIDSQSPNFLRDTIRIYKRPGFDLNCVPDIEFLNDICIDGIICIDEGMSFIGMAPPVAKYITTKSIDKAAALVSLEDIPDLEYRQCVNNPKER